MNRIDNVVHEGAFATFIGTSAGYAKSSFPDPTGELAFIAELALETVKRRAKAKEKREERL